MEDKSYRRFPGTSPTTPRSVEDKKHEPMEIDALKFDSSEPKKLSENEKEERKRNKKCAYCGSKSCGGFPITNDCSTLKKKKSNLNGGSSPA
jgi:hypothetical protein